MAVLLTGVGYIGSALLRDLLADGERVIGLENFYCTSRESFAALQHLRGYDERFTLLEGDVAEPADVAHAFDLAAASPEPLTVYHLAAQPSAAAAARDPDYTERTNLIGARLVLEAARDRGARVIFGGSFRIYGDELPSGSVVEESAPYGRMGDLSHLSKLYVEQLARMLGLPFVSVRLGVVYGRAPVTKTEPPFMTVANLFCQRAVRGEVLQVLEDRHLAFLHVDDAARALRAAAAQLPLEPAWQVANACAEVLSIGEVARLVQRLAHQRGRFVRIHTAPGGGQAGAPYAVASRLEAFGFVPRFRMADTLGEVLDSFLAPSAAR